jgi:hypothetical protein
MRRFMILLAAVILTACTTARTNVLNESFSPITDHEVIMVGDRQDIPDDLECVTVAYIESKSLFDNTTKMVRKIKEEAAKIGANYVVFKGFDTTSRGEYGSTDEANAVAYHCEEK